MGIGDNIKRIRKEKDMTIKELAAKVRIHFSTIGHIEQGNRNPSIEVLKSIAKALDVDVNTLLSDDDSLITYINEIPGLESNVLHERAASYNVIPDIKEAMQVIMTQPGLMLNGETLTDEDKIILANAIQMGLKLAEEMRNKRKNEGKEGK